VRILIDTNRYRDILTDRPEAVQVVRHAKRVYVPFITLAELRAGFRAGTRATRNEAALRKFLSRPSARVLYADEETTHHYARLFAQLRQQGTPIPTNDIWIAALAEQHGLLLYSRDKHFDLLPQLARVD
jgi:tRNA(fMet)-specific endonuclease VapC